MKAISRLYRFHVLIFLFVYLRMRPLICLFIRNRWGGGGRGGGKRRRALEPDLAKAIAMSAIPETLQPAVLTKPWPSTLRKFPKLTGRSTVSPVV